MSRSLPSMATKGSVDTSPAEIINEGGTDGIPAAKLMAGIMGMVPSLGGRKVVVGFHGDQAFCNKGFSYVNLPELPKGAIIPHSIAYELRGFAAHEASHLLWTDEADLERYRTEEEKKDQLFHETWNAVEDYMIERNWLLEFEGGAKCFTATEIRCCRSYLGGYVKNPDMAKDLRIVGPVSLTWLRAKYFGLNTPQSEECLQTMPPLLRQRMEDWFDKIVDVQTTKECIEIARLIHADIAANPFDPNDPPASQNQQSGHGSQGGQQGSGSQGGNGAGGQGSATGAPQPPAQGPISTSASLADAMNQLAQQNPLHKPLEYTSFTVNSSRDSGPAKDALTMPEGRKEYAKAEIALGGAAATTAQSLRRALITRTRSKWKGGRSDGILDHRRVADAALGIPEIYKRRTKAETIDTAVEILVDCSGSMTSSIQICQQLAIILHKSFYGTPIKYEILGYTTGSYEDLDGDAKIMAAAIESHNQQVVASGGNTDKLKSVRAISIYEFKDFRGRVHEVSETIGNMSRAPMGGTPTADAIVEAHLRLSRQPQRRHVMFVLTDGAPDDTDACKQAVKSVEQAGVSVIGIGIGSSAVKSAFRNWCKVSRAEDLPAVVLSKIAGTLSQDKNLKGQRRRAA